jgi:hypothetical protein
MHYDSFFLAGVVRLRCPSMYLDVFSTRRYFFWCSFPFLPNNASKPLSVFAGVDALAHCVAAVGAAARAAVAAISPEDRACMQEAVKCSQTAAAEEASAPVVAAHRTSAQVRVSKFACAALAAYRVCVFCRTMQHSYRSGRRRNSRKASCKQAVRSVETIRHQVNTAILSRILCHAFSTSVAMGLFGYRESSISATFRIIYIDNDAIVSQKSVKEGQSRISTVTHSVSISKRLELALVPDTLWRDARFGHFDIHQAQHVRLLWG